MRIRIALAAMLAVALLPSAARAATTYRIPASACTSSGDSAPAIESFLATVPNGASPGDVVVLFPPGAQCRVARKVDLGAPPAGQPHRQDVVFALRDATIFRDEEPSCENIDACNGPVVALNEVRDVTLSGGSIRGGAHWDGLPHFDATREHDHGLAVHGSIGVTLKQLSISDVAGDCVDVDRLKGDHTAHVRVAGTPAAPFTCEGAGRQGISANAVTDLTISGVGFDRIAASAVDLEGRGRGEIEDVRIIGNAFGWIGDYAVAGIGSTPTFRDVVVGRNAQTDPAHTGLAFLRAGNSFDRGPLLIVDNHMLAPVQLNHMSGRATGNVLAAGHGVRCMFQLFNRPPFDASGNRHPVGVAETCAFSGRIGAPGPPVGGLRLGWLLALATLVVVAGLALARLRRRRRRPA